VAAGVGALVAVGVLVTVFCAGFGDGWAATVRVRVDGELIVSEEFEFCAQPHPAHDAIIEVATRSFFSIT
jgi:hypothetical protein